VDGASMFTTIAFDAPSPWTASVGRHAGAADLV
jgi:hypothetical protein